MNSQNEFSVSLAGVVFRISCVHPSTRRLCNDYLVEDGEAVEYIRITPADIQWERARHLAHLKPGETLEAESSESLERLHLCRRISELMPKYDRVLFHGSSLSIEGQGVLFTAKSGTGKSTHTRNWRKVFGDRVKMVNDDKPFLHITDGGVTVWGSPWQGKHGLGENISAPLEAICFLNRGEDNHIAPIPPRELYPLLLQQTYTPDDPGMMGKTLALVDRLSRNTRLFKLYCNMDPASAQVAFHGIETELGE